MFLRTLDDASPANPPVSQARFSPYNLIWFPDLRMPYLRGTLLILIALMFGACESTLVRQVHYYEEVGDTESARQYLEAALQRRPDDSEARYLLGKVLFSESQFAAGRKAFDQVEAQTAKYSESIQYILESSFREVLQKSIDALDENQFEEAVRFARYASEIRPEYHAGHSLMGFSLTQTGQLNDAALAYQQAVMIDPADEESWNNLSEIAFVNQNYADARDYSNEVLRLDAQNIGAQRRLAHAHLHLKENAPAKDAFEQLLAISNEAMDVQDFAFFLFNTGDFESSLPHLEALAEGPDPSHTLLKTLGEAYAGLQRFKQVIAINEQILGQYPEDREAIGNLIAAHERLGQFEQAKKLQSRLSNEGGEM